MAAKVVSVANQKGGSGKTTVSMGLTGALARRGYRVLVVDADKQGSATRWASAAPDEAPFPAAVSGLSAAGAKVHQEVKKHLANYDLIVIDCPPAVESPIPMSALMVTDLVLVPVVPSPPDLWAAMGIIEMINNVRENVNETLEARLVANLCQPNTEVAREALEVLRSLGVPLAKSRLHLRTAHRQAAAYGRSVFDLTPRSAAAAAIVELDGLCDEVLEALNLESTNEQQEAVAG